MYFCTKSKYGSTRAFITQSNFLVLRWAYLQKLEGWKKQ